MSNGARWSAENRNKVEIMSRGSVNKVILIGNLGQDPEVRYMANGNAVAKICFLKKSTLFLYFLNFIFFLL